MEILAGIGIVLLVLILGGLAVGIGLSAYYFILGLWPTLLGLFLLISLWRNGNDNLGVLSFIAGIIGNYYWNKYSDKIGWYKRNNSSVGYTDDRTQKEILRDIERKINDPYS